jgi:hypothetical protein
VPETCREVVVPETCREVVVPETCREVVVPETCRERPVGSSRHLMGLSGGANGAREPSFMRLTEGR